MDTFESRDTMELFGRHEGYQAIAAVGIFDPSYPRIAAWSYSRAKEAGLILGQDQPSAWEASKFGAQGSNLGNLVWGFGAHTLVASRLEHNRTKIMSAPRDEFLALYIAQGPILEVKGTESDVELRLREQYVLEVVLDVERPMIVLGIGIGAAVANCSTAELSDGSMDFLEKLKSRISMIGGFVGFRGECGARLAHRAGFRQGFEAMGCPSLFINKKVGLGRRLQSRYSTLKLHLLDETRSLRIGLLCDGSHLDRDLSELLFLRGAVGSVVLYQDPRDDWCQEYVQLSNEENVKTVAHFDIERWREAVSGLDLVIGPRIHGSMISISMEVPVITFSIDARIQEMCEMMRLACVPYQESSSPLPVRAIIERMIQAINKFNGTEFDYQRQALAERYVSVFKKYRIESQPELIELARKVDSVVL